MSSETHLGDGISLKECRTDLGLAVASFRASFGRNYQFDPNERLIKIPADITGYNSKAEWWIVLELVAAPELIIAASGDLLAVRRTREPRNGQLAIIKHEEQVLIKRIFLSGSGVVLRALDATADLLVMPAAIDVRGTIEGLALEGCWYKLITSEKLPR